MRLVDGLYAIRAYRVCREKRGIGRPQGGYSWTGWRSEAGDYLACEKPWADAMWRAHTEAVFGFRERLTR